MKPIALAAPIMMAALVGMAPLAHADDDGGAAALGFMLGAIAAAPTYAYGPPATYVYQTPSQVVVQGSGPGYYYSAPPRVYYRRFRDHDGWRDGWHRRQRDADRRRNWRHDDD